MSRLDKNRGPVERTRVLIWAEAEVQDNGDGTWSAALPLILGSVVTADSRERVLSLLGERHSVKKQP